MSTKFTESQNTFKTKPLLNVRSKSQAGFFTFTDVIVEPTSRLSPASISPFSELSSQQPQTTFDFESTLQTQCMNIAYSESYFLWSRLRCGFLTGVFLRILRPILRSTIEPVPAPALTPQHNWPTSRFNASSNSTDIFFCNPLPFFIYRIYQKWDTHILLFLHESFLYLVFRRKVSAAPYELDPPLSASWRDAPDVNRLSSPPISKFYLRRFSHEFNHSRRPIRTQYSL